MCTNLGTNVFDYGKKSAADQMRTSWEKLVQYVGTNYGQDINNELQNKVWSILTEPAHTNYVLSIHSVRGVMIRYIQLNIQQSGQAQETILKAAVQSETDIDAPMKLAILQNEKANFLPVSRSQWYSLTLRKLSSEMIGPPSKNAIPT
jgi:hypothetical protein